MSKLIKTESQRHAQIQVWYVILPAQIFVCAWEVCVKHQTAKFRRLIPQAASSPISLSFLQLSSVSDYATSVGIQLDRTDTEQSLLPTTETPLAHF